MVKRQPLSCLSASKKLPNSDFGFKSLRREKSHKKTLRFKLNSLSTPTGVNLGTTDYRTHTNLTLHRSTFSSGIQNCTYPYSNQSSYRVARKWNPLFIHCDELTLIFVEFCDVLCNVSSIYVSYDYYIFENEKTRSWDPSISQ